MLNSKSFHDAQLKRKMPSHITLLSKLKDKMDHQLIKSSSWPSSHDTMLIGCFGLAGAIVIIHEKQFGIKIGNVKSSWRHSDRDERYTIHAIRRSPHQSRLHPLRLEQCFLVRESRESWDCRHSWRHDKGMKKEMKRCDIIGCWSRREWKRDDLKELKLKELRISERSKEDRRIAEENRQASNLLLIKLLEGNRTDSLSDEG